MPKSNRLAQFKLYCNSELENAFQLWLESMQARGLSPKSVKGYASEVGHFVRFLREQLNLTDLDAVQPHHIRKWLLYRQQQGISNAQLHNDYRMLCCNDTPADYRHPPRKVNAHTKRTQPQKNCGASCTPHPSPTPHDAPNATPDYEPHPQTCA
jgi:hypothetical protein